MFVGKECTFTHWMLKGNAEASLFVVFKTTAYLSQDIYLFHMQMSVVYLVIIIIGYAFFA